MKGDHKISEGDESSHVPCTCLDGMVEEVDDVCVGVVQPAREVAPWRAVINRKKVDQVKS